MKPMNERLQGLVQSAVKYKYVWLVLLFGIVLMLLPSKEREQAIIETPATQTPAPETIFDRSQEERRLQDILCAIRGAGECRVLLAVEGTEETELAADGEGTIVLSGGSSGEKTVTLRYVYPVYQGAVVVSTGAGDPTVKYDLLNAVMTYTGLRSDQISICAMYE